MCRALRIALPLLVLAGCAAPRKPEVPTGPSFTILTWNVNWGGPGPELVPRTIAAEDPDIVCLQETTPAWEAFLRPALERRYPHIAFRHSGGAGGQALLSRLPFREVSYEPSPVGWFPVWTVVAETPAGSVQIQNLHLHPAVNERGSVTPAAYLYTSPKARLKEVKTSTQVLDPQVAALVVGDLNEEDSYAVDHLGTLGFIDALAEFDTSSHTWKWRTSVGITVTSRLDHILYDRHLHCTEARVVKAGASDHDPVVAVFQRGGTPGEELP